MKKTVVIIQSSYIPWKGYFDLINRADEFVLFDDAQFTRRDWRSRNRIKTANGPTWLSVPVTVDAREQSIRNTFVADQKWRRKHWTAIELNYSRAPYFEKFSAIFRDLYLASDEASLSLINRAFIEAINAVLGITTPLHWSSSFQLREGRTDRLLGICRDLGATTYLSGPNARGYLETETFEAEGVAVEWMDYSDYPEYPQLYPPFVHEVSILDLIFNTGEHAKRYMKSFPEAVQ